MSRRLAVRLPLLAALAVGAWLWRSDLFPQPRELVLLLPPARAPATGAEVQLYSEGGALLKREELFFDGSKPAPSVLRLELPLQRGRYLCRAFVRDAAGAERALSRSVEVGEPRTYDVELEPAR